MRVIEVSPQSKYITPDGRLTAEGLKLLKQLIDQQRDHESRITALEP